MSEQIMLSLMVTEPDAVRQLTEQPASHRQAYALAALQIGLLSLRHAGGAIDADAVKHQGELLVKELNHAIERYSVVLTDALKSGSDFLLTSLQQTIATDFSMDNEHSWLRRFSVGMSEERQKLVAELGAQLAQQLGELSFDKKDSAINRLAETIEASQRTITKQFSLDEPSSALVRLRNEMISILDELNSNAQSFQAEVRSTMEKLEVRKEEATRSTTHGVAFEQCVISFVKQHAGLIGDVAEATGATTGVIKFCKVGDAVIELGPESAAPGERIVVEAKEVVGYTVTQALAEIEQAQKNREAAVGIFVFSKKTAPEALCALSRYKDSVVVVWDAERAESDVILSAAISLARALSFKKVKARSAEAADFTKLDGAILEVEREAARLDQMCTWTMTIQSNSTKLADEIRKMQAGLARQLVALREATEGLK